MAFTPSSRESLDELAARCDARGFARSEIVDFGDGWVLDVPDPDGTVLRFYHFTGRTDVFTGYSSASGGLFERYSEPLLQVARRWRHGPAATGGRQRLPAAWTDASAALGQDHRPARGDCRRSGDQRVDGECSFVETLRHLLFVTDSWVSRGMLGVHAPHHPLGLPPTGMKAVRGLELDARP